MQYVGIRRPSPFTKGNLGTVWIKTEDGKYKETKSGLILESWQINSDLRNGYLKPEGKNSLVV